MHRRARRGCPYADIAVILNHKPVNGFGIGNTKGESGSRARADNVYLRSG